MKNLWKVVQLILINSDKNQFPQKEKIPHKKNKGKGDPLDSARISYEYLRSRLG